MAKKGGIGYAIRKGREKMLIITVVVLTILLMALLGLALYKGIFKKNKMNNPYSSEFEDITAGTKPDMDGKNPLAITQEKVQQETKAVEVEQNSFTDSKVKTAPIPLQEETVERQSENYETSLQSNPTDVKSNDLEQPEEVAFLESNYEAASQEEYMEPNKVDFDEPLKTENEQIGEFGLTEPTAVDYEQPTQESYIETNELKHDKIDSDYLNEPKEFAEPSQEDFEDQNVDVFNRSLEADFDSVQYDSEAQKNIVETPLSDELEEANEVAFDQPLEADFDSVQYDSLASSKGNQGDFEEKKAAEFEAAEPGTFKEPELTDLQSPDVFDSEDKNKEK